MNLYKFILKSLIYYWRQHLAVLAGTILSTAVLTGALIIGDSVKYSLRHMVDLRLGKARFALITRDRFVRDQLGNEIAGELDVKSSSLLVVQGITINSNNNKRINSTNVYGIESSFWEFSETGGEEMSDNELLISDNIAQKLELTQGDEVLLRLENAEVIPLNAPFATQETNSVSMRMKVKAVLNKDQLSRFSIKSDQKSPNNVFISKKVLQEKLDLKGLSNLVILSDNSEQNIDNDKINQALKKHLQINDISLKIRSLDDGKFELVSDRIFIDKSIADVLDSLKHKQENILTYLVNSISFNGKETPYSFVSAIQSSEMTGNLKENEIIINNWLADDLGAKKGDSLKLAYYIIGPLRKLKEESKYFKIKDIIPLENSEEMKSLMPSFPGLSDAGHCREWETGVPIDLDKIRDKDEDYWNEYKGSPKAFISITSGQKLWENQFGKLTAVRFDSSQISQTELKNELLDKINPSEFNLSSQAIHVQGVAATVNAVDFGQLFLSLSFFVIVGGVLLTLLLHSLNTISRTSETGLLSGLGFEGKSILKIRLGESLLIVLLGGILGAIVGIIYNYALLAGLNSVWYDVVRTSMIEVYINPGSLIIGAISGTIISLIPIYLISRKKFKQTAAFLIKNGSSGSTFNAGKRNYSLLICVLSFLIVVGLLAYSFVTGIESSAGLFLSAGALALVSGTVLLDIVLSQKNNKDKVLDINSLAIKNSGRNKGRSLTTVVLLALGVYVIFVTGANRKTFYGDNTLNSSGTGGYLLWAETSLPILENLNSQTGRNKLGINDTTIISGTSFMQLHSLDGDDASCLNLNQVQQPRILGVDANQFNTRKSFSFANLLPGIDKNLAWLSLDKKTGDNLIPAIADQTVLTWGLKKEVGDTLIYLNDAGEAVKLLIIGGLNNSIFQGNVLIADQFLTENFPSAAGSKVMLVDAPGEKTKQLEDYLSTYLADYGIEISKATDRLAEFNSVTNTYLTVFMALGGLGVLIGTIGLGIVLLRNIIERKAELALMAAIGFTRKQMFLLVFKENLFLLATGIVLGIISSFIGILPSILSPSFEIPGAFVFILVAIVLISGLLWIYFPTKYALKTVPVKALRKE